MAVILTNTLLFFSFDALKNATKLKQSFSIASCAMENACLYNKKYSILLHLVQSLLTKLQLKAAN